MYAIEYFQSWSIDAVNFIRLGDGHLYSVLQTSITVCKLISTDWKMKCSYRNRISLALHLKIFNNTNNTIFFPKRSFIKINSKTHYFNSYLHFTHNTADHRRILTILLGGWHKYSVANMTVGTSPPHPQQYQPIQ